jgi:hypothetical protein
MKGKIGRLPWQIRQQLNVRIRDGVPDTDIIAWLNALPETKAVLSDLSFGGRRATVPEITPANLSEYRRAGGPYEEWLSKQERVDAVQTMSEFALRMAQAVGGDVNQTAVAVAGGKILEILEGSEGDDLVKYAAALSSLNRSEADKVKAATTLEMLSVRRRQLALDEARFERQTCELFIKWYADKQAAEIAGSTSAPDIKIDQLRTLMFGAPAASEAQP